MSAAGKGQWQLRRPGGVGGMWMVGAWEDHRDAQRQQFLE
jgi:hypothetical protein